MIPTDRPWAITEPWLKVVLEAAAHGRVGFEAVAKKLGAPLKDTASAENRDGVAVIPVSGPLFRHADFFTMLFGASSYDVIARDFAAAVADPDVKAIVLDCDSPGGEVTGCGELSTMVYAARGKKPITAYVGGDCASGAYWIASAADEIVAAPTGVLGSIGVRSAILDDSKAQEKQGIRIVKVVSSQSPHKVLDPNDDDDLARAQRTVDDLAAVFVSHVARNRGVSTSTVLKQYGRGDVMVGKAAARAGLADRIGSFEGVIARLSSGGTANPPRAAASTETKMAKALKCSKCDDDFADDDEAFCKKCMDGDDDARADDGDDDDSARKALAAALGLEATAGRELIAASVAGLIELRTRLAALTGKATSDEMLGAITAMRDAQVKVAELTASSAAQAQRTIDQEVAAELERGGVEFKITRAQLTGWAPKFLGCKVAIGAEGKIKVSGATPSSLAQLTAYLEFAPAMVKGAGTSLKAPVGDAIALTEEEIRIGAKLGVTEEQMVASKREQIKRGITIVP